MKFAILYWGLIRGFKYDDVFESHKKNMWDKLDKMNIPFDVYCHTYNKEFDDKVFQIPNMKQLIIEDDQIIENYLTPRIRNVVVPHYYYKDAKINLFKCWYSQEQLRKLLDQSKENYSLIITMDISQMIYTNFLEDQEIDTTQAYTLKYECFGGYNPRFFVANKDHTLFYLNKLNYILADEDNIPPFMISEIEKKLHLKDGLPTPNLHPETMLRHYLEYIGKIPVFLVPIKIFRVRSDHTIHQEL